MLPIMKLDEKEELFKKVEEYYSINKDNYYKMIVYYKRNWINNTYINYYDLNNLEYINRANNYIENYHFILTNKLESYHPKISYLIEKYCEYLKENYNKIKSIV